MRGCDPIYTQRLIKAQVCSDILLLQISQRQLLSQPSSMGSPPENSVAAKGGLTENATTKPEGGFGDYLVGSAGIFKLNALIYARRGYSDMRIAGTGR